MKPLFDVCLITRNESKTLPRCVASLQEFRDRGGVINVCDTGSTDGTAEIARVLGCNVIEVGDKFRHTITEEQAKAINDRFIVANEYPIVNAGESYFDFASARNESVDMASQDMICTVDADEVLTKLDIDKINEAIKEGYTQFEYNFVFSHNWDGSELVKFIQSKMYDRTVCRWLGIIHEMVTPIDSAKPSKIKFLDEDVFKLEHWQNPETNRTGYLKGLAVDCFEHQEKDRNSHYFARELWWNGRPWSAAKEFKRHIEMRAWPAERAESMLFLGDIYGAMEHKEEQLEWFHKALDTEPNRREPLIKLAQTHMRRNEPIPANFYATAALELPWYPFYGANKAFYTNEPHEILYWAKGWMGDIPGAQKHILECFKYMPEHPNYWRDAAFYFDYPGNRIEGWMSFEEQQFLYNTAKKMETVCEIGSWKGRSTHAIATGCPGQVTAVDTFAGSQDERDETLWRAKQSDVYAEFLVNTSGLKNITVVKKESSDAAQYFPEKSFDMVFIDAEHTYEGVKKDIRNWKDKAKIVLCGHDYSSGWPGVMQAVDEELGGPDEVHGSIWVKWLATPKVSICIPTLGRPHKLNRLLNTIKQNAEYSNYEIIVKADEMPPNNVGAPKMLAKCYAESTGELIMFLGNDVVPKPGFLREAVWEMVRRFPDLDGMVGLNDNYWQEQHVAPHFLISRKLVDEHLEGEIFHTGYNHTGCDNELRARVEKLNKYSFGKKAQIFHDHPYMAGSKADNDIFYEQAYSGPRHDADDKLYKKRAKKYGFADRKWT
jgi:glycosyltransferase involved in cell wall biosynthesis